jgi:hypothetical protein
MHDEIARAVAEVTTALGPLRPGHDQDGLVFGETVVREFLAHGDVELALDHLRYMRRELAGRSAAR